MLAGDVETVKKLINVGADIDSLGEIQSGIHLRTPLHWACIMGSKDCAMLIIEAGATINAKDSMQRTPLHWYGFLVT